MSPLNDSFYGVVSGDEMMIFEEEEKEVIIADLNDNIMCSFHKILERSSQRRKLFFGDDDESSFTSQFFECERYVFQIF